MCAIVIALSIGCITQLAVSAQVCSNFCCSSLGILESNPGKSCADIYQINKATRGVSHDYWINTTTGIYQVYCDMELECGGHKGGWMRIADYDTSRDDCPKGWNKITANGIAVCRSPSDSAGCYSSMFSTYNVGKVRGYQKGSPSAFAEVSVPSLDNGYVEGISITLGNPRKHVWTYAIGLSDDGNHQSGIHNCPCARNRGLHLLENIIIVNLASLPAHLLSISIILKTPYGMAPGA